MAPPLSQTVTSHIFEPFYALPLATDREDFALLPDYYDLNAITPWNLLHVHYFLSNITGCNLADESQDHRVINPCLAGVLRNGLDYGRAPDFASLTALSVNHLDTMRRCLILAKVPELNRVPFFHAWNFNARIFDFPIWANPCQVQSTLAHGLIRHYYPLTAERLVRQGFRLPASGG